MLRFFLGYSWKKLRTFGVGHMFSLVYDCGLLFASQVNRHSRNLHSHEVLALKTRFPMKTLWLIFSRLPVTIAEHAVFRTCSDRIARLELWLDGRIIRKIAASGSMKDFPLNGNYR